jgi:DNA (cytosine-5)-methyltransferase 1
MSDTLWPYIKEAISTIRPSIVFLENVRGHFGLGFRDVLTDLASIGYDVRWSLIRASDVGAPHRRERLFIVAYPKNCAMDSCPAEYRRRTPALLRGKKARIVEIYRHRQRATAIGKTQRHSEQESQFIGNHNLSLVEWARLSTRKMYRLHWIKVN